METLNQVLEKTFNVSLGDTFEAKAAYYSAMDCVEYLREDAFAVSERIDGFLTLYTNAEGTEVTGFKCKGFRFVFEKIRQRNPSIAEKHFIPMIKFIEEALTELGDSVFEGNRKAYEDAKRLASQDNVEVEMPANLAA